MGYFLENKYPITATPAMERPTPTTHRFSSNQSLTGEMLGAGVGLGAGGAVSVGEGEGGTGVAVGVLVGGPGVKV